MKKNALQVRKKIHDSFCPSNKNIHKKIIFVFIKLTASSTFSCRIEKKGQNNGK